MWHQVLLGFLPSQIGTKRHECEVCGKNYQSHIQAVHQGERPHVCTICDETFNEQSGLSHHINGVHHGEKPHKYEVCVKSFSRRETLTRHIQTVHPRGHINVRIVGKLFLNGNILEVTSCLFMITGNPTNVKFVGRTLGGEDS